MFNLTQVRAQLGVHILGQRKETITKLSQLKTF